MRLSPKYLIIALIVMSGCTRSEATFEALTIPAESLPSGCELAPTAGLPLGRSDRENPITITDPEVSAMIGILMLQSEPVAQIDAAYLAEYKDAANRENAVWAIQFSDPGVAKTYSEEMNEARQSSGSRYVADKGSILVFAWTDNTSDLSCFDAIRGYLEKI
jgi:hypothetical protein